MKVIGITGPTGAGKTTALNALVSLGGRIIDADAVYHTLTRTSQPMRQELEARFGPVYTPQGELDRKKLGAVVFQDPQALADLNAITHRYVGQAVAQQVAEAEADGVPVVGIDAIGLLESSLVNHCHRTVAVTAPEELRVKRIMAREGIPEDYAWSRVRAQKPEEYFRGHCGHVLVNDCASAEEFSVRAKALLQTILQQTTKEV